MVAEARQLVMDRLPCELKSEAIAEEMLRSMRPSTIRQYRSWWRAFARKHWSLRDLSMELLGKSKAVKATAWAAWQHWERWSQHDQVIRHVCQVHDQTRKKPPTQYLSVDWLRVIHTIMKPRASAAGQWAQLVMGLAIELLARCSDLWMLGMPIRTGDSTEFKLVMHKTGTQEQVFIRSSYLQERLWSFHADHPGDRPRFLAYDNNDISVDMIRRTMNNELHQMGLPPKSQTVRKIVASALAKLIPSWEVDKLGRWSGQNTRLRHYEVDAPSVSPWDLICEHYCEV